MKSVWLKSNLPPSAWLEPAANSECGEARGGLLYLITARAFSQFKALSQAPTGVMENLREQISSLPSDLESWMTNNKHFNWIGGTKPTCLNLCPCWEHGEGINEVWGKLGGGSTPHLTRTAPQWPLCSLFCPLLCFLPESLYASQVYTTLWYLDCDSHSPDWWPGGCLGPLGDGSVLPVAFSSGFWTLGTDWTTPIAWPTRTVLSAEAFCSSVIRTAAFLWVPFGCVLICKAYLYSVCLFSSNHIIFPFTFRFVSFQAVIPSPLSFVRVFYVSIRIEQNTCGPWRPSRNPISCFSDEEVIMDVLPPDTLMWTVKLVLLWHMPFPSLSAVGRSETGDGMGLDHGYPDPWVLVVVGVLVGYFFSLRFSLTHVLYPTLSYINSILFHFMSVSINSILYIPSLVQVDVEKYTIPNCSVVCSFFQQIFV